MASALALGGDFLQGFQGESDKIRQENQREQDKIDQRNQRVFETLANSDDPEIRAAAVTGLLTGNHPNKGLDKWFGTVQKHPIHETIRGLVGGGHEAFMDPVKRHGAELSADLDAKRASIDKSGLSPENKERATLGMYGAPPPRPVPAQPGTVHLKDGSTVAGFFYDGGYYDGNYQPISDAVSFTKGNAPGVQENGALEPDANSPTGYSKVYRNKADGKEIYRVNAPAPDAAQGNFTAVPNAASPTGISRFERKGGTVSNAPAAGVKPGEPPPAPVVAPAPAGTDISSLRSIEESILRLHPQPKPLYTGGAISPEKDKAWRAALDAEAKNYQFDNYAALQAAIAQAQQGVAGRTGTATPPPAVPGATAAPGKNGKPGGPQANTGAGRIDVQSIIDEVRKGKKNTGTSGAPGAK